MRQFAECNSLLNSNDNNEIQKTKPLFTFNSSYDGCTETGGKTLMS
jgi:hypothetical protein